MKSIEFIKLATATSVVCGLLCTAVGAMAQTSFAPGDKSVLPVNDAFYKSPSAASLASLSNGQIIRFREITAPDSTNNITKAYQLMYRSTDNKNAPSASVTTVLIPTNAPAAGRRQIMSYQSFYDSLTSDCTPSYLTLQGKMFESTTVNTSLKKGYVVVLSDYEGLDNQWIVGLNTAHGVLDGIRAAINFTPAGVSPGAAVALAGFSGGGHASAWAAELADEYAPDLNIVGTAMGGVPVNIKNVANKVDGGLFSSVYLGAVVGLSRAYPEIEPAKYATTAGLAAIKDMGSRCLLGVVEGKKDMLFKYAFKKSTTYLKDANFLDLPEIDAIIQANNLGSRKPNAPVYVYEGTNDEIMPIADVDALVAKYCSQGITVQYNRTTGDHVLMGVSPTPMLNWAFDRLAGKAATSTCK